LPLCPIGTYARDQAEKEKNQNRPADWSVREKQFFRDVFQNIEGGVGFWGNTRFPTKSPKYRINGIPDCYTTRIGSPGWPFGETNALADQAMGLAQLSNRILVPPDGIPFAAGPEEEHWVPELLGVAWMALPFYGLRRLLSPAKQEIRRRRKGAWREAVISTERINWRCL
jgi:hypothetical protein